MKDFEYSAPNDLQTATALLAKHGERARVLAGGTDIIVQLREGLRSADFVVDIKNIPELMALEYSPRKGLTLGGSTSCQEIYRHADLGTAYPALIDSAKIVGGWQIQTRASVGGNLCNSSPAADTIPALLVHQATCQIQGPAGSREVPASEFCTGPGQNVLQAGELLVSLQLPAPAANSSSAYQRFIPRNEMDIAVAGAASWIQLDSSGQTIEEARIALAAVAATPVMATEAAESLRGKPATAESFAEAGELAKNAASPISDMRGTAEYRVHLCSVLTQRTLARALARIQESNS